MIKLFKDTPAELEKRIDRLVGHFRHAEFRHREQKSKDDPTAAELLWILFREAVATEQRLPDKEKRMVSQVGNGMPSARTTIDQAYAVELSRLLTGMKQYDSTSVRVTVHQTDVERMVDVNDLLRFVAAGPRGQDVQRYKRVFIAHAAGYGPEFCTKVWDRHRVSPMSRQGLHDIKQRVLGQILAGIKREFGLEKTARGFRRKHVRSIEQYQKIKKRIEGQP